MGYFIVSTTGRTNYSYLRLPDRCILGSLSENFLVNNTEELKSVLEYCNNSTIIADCEKKQNISIYDQIIMSHPNVIDYKPNDLTMEATDLAIINYFEKKLSNKTIGIYGTGNIAFKLALRLTERNCYVHLFGRDSEKIDVCVKAIEQVTFDSQYISRGSLESNLDCLVSFISAEEVIDSSYVNLLNRHSLCLDGGIGNFSKEFIGKALNNGHDVRRLDVRQSQEIMDGYIKSRVNSSFNQIIGRDIINNNSVVAGGIIGKEGEIIVDRIVNPTKVIGIANGIGGVKNEYNLSSEEQYKIQEVQSVIEQNS